MLLCVVLVCAIVGYFVYEAFYFQGEKFLIIKKSVQSYIQECNELNEHVEELKKSYIDVNKTDYGNANYVDNSLYNFKRSELRHNISSTYVYDCSLSVCKNAQQQPFKYLCKYFNIKTDEDTLVRFERVLNDFSAAEQGKTLLVAKKNKIIESVSTEIPFFIRKLRPKTVESKLGFKDINLNNLHFPKYTFRYVSAGGNSSMQCDVVLNIENLDKFVNYLAGIVKFRKSVAGQRALMTPALREKIKQRDNYTCQKCGISVNDEPHLLLEIDHITSLANGGLSIEDNLQTLCWKCNRKKGKNNDV